MTSTEMQRESSSRQSRRSWRSALKIAMLLPLAYLAGLAWFAVTLPKEPDSLPAEATDAVVVVTGGSGRFGAGLRMLQAGRGAKLFVSGVDRTAGLTELLKNAPRLDALEDLQCCIVLGYRATDTVGNAAETAEWMREQGFRSLRLVTSNYHMRRAALEFRIAMPDLTILTYPVEPAGASREPWWRSPATLGLIVNEQAKFLITAAKYVAFEARRIAAGKPA